MTIIESFITKNSNYINRRPLRVKGLMLHSVGVPQPDPRIFFNNFNQLKPGGREVGVHAFLGQDGTVLHTMPWESKAWHCGQGPKGSANDTHIGIEMTEPASIKYEGGVKDLDPAKTKAFIQNTYNVAKELFAKLCKDFGLNPLEDGVILSHSEGHTRGIASNHSDVEHLWRLHGLSMNQFRTDVKTAMTPSPPAPAPETHQSVKFDLLGKKTDILGKIIDGRTYAQVRELLTEMGYDVSWDEASKTVVVRRP